MSTTVMMVAAAGHITPTCGMVIYVDLVLCMNRELHCLACRSAFLRALNAYTLRHM